ncbi:MAG: hypothetical protein CMN30_17755 [Sandaracinus sp.]|nr:hypothetical protein [Sandaracinus sp.]
MVGEHHVHAAVGEVFGHAAAEAAAAAGDEIPRTLADLDGHLLVHYASALSSATLELEYLEDGELCAHPMAASITVNGSDAYAAACHAGLGIVQVPRMGIRDGLASGELVAILPDLPCPPLPVFLLHTHGRRLPQRVRAVARWIADVITPELE